MSISINAELLWSRIIAASEHIKLKIWVSNEKYDLLFSNCEMDTFKTLSGWIQDQEEIEIIQESVKTKVVILLVSETKLIFFFLLKRFHVDGFTSQFTFGWFYQRKSIMVYIRGDIPFKTLTEIKSTTEIEKTAFWFLL